MKNKRILTQLQLEMKWWNNDKLRYLHYCRYTCKQRSKKPNYIVKYIFVRGTTNWKKFHSQTKHSFILNGTQKSCLYKKPCKCPKQSKLLDNVYNDNKYELKIAFHNNSWHFLFKIHLISIKTSTYADVMPLNEFNSLAKSILRFTANCVYLRERTREGKRTRGSDTRLISILHTSSQFQNTTHNTAKHIHVLHSSSSCATCTCKCATNRRKVKKRRRK